MSDQSNSFLTGIGRIVMGHPLRGQDKDAENNPLVYKTGANMGQPYLKFFTALAIPKTDVGYAEIWAKIHGVARAGFPSLFDAAGNCTNPAFAFKVVDGDSTVPNRNGKTPASREGFPGHWVLYFSNSFPPKVVGIGGVHETTEVTALKTGDYVRIAGEVVANGAVNQPGVYLNYKAVEIVYFGEEISTGIDTVAVFGGTPITGAMPAGASATPIAGAPSAAMAPPAAPGAAPPPPIAAPPPMAAPPPIAAPAAPMAQLPPPVAAPMAPPPVAAPVQPAPDILNPPAGTVAPAHTMTAAATYTYEQYRANSWTDEQLRAQGLMV